jgi:hypothetical protein
VSICERVLTTIEETDNLDCADVFSRKDTETDERFKELRGYWANIDARVESFWEKLKAEPCTLKVAPPNVRIPEEATPCFSYKKAYGFEDDFSFVGVSSERKHEYFRQWVECVQGYKPFE